MSNKKCVLYDRDCIDCKECEYCDLDPTKICDNCGKCIKTDDFYSVKIDSFEGVYSENDIKQEADKLNIKLSPMKGTFKVKK